jgi:hypothetical protein
MTLTTKNRLPKIIKSCIDELYGFLNKKHDDGFSFFEEADMPDPEIRMAVLEEEMGPICTANWIKNGEAGLSRTQVSKILDRIPLLYTFYSLKKKGFMDSIEGNNGEEIFFLSDKGKEFGMLMNWDKKQE